MRISKANLKILPKNYNLLRLPYFPRWPATLPVWVLVLWPLHLGKHCTSYKTTGHIRGCCATCIATGKKTSFTTGAPVELAGDERWQILGGHVLWSCVLTLWWVTLQVNEQAASAEGKGIQLHWCRPVGVFLFFFNNNMWGKYYISIRNNLPSNSSFLSKPLES